MDRVGIFVDAGYVFAAGSKLITGTKQVRSELELDEDRFLDLLKKHAATVSSLPLLRVYWYDGTSSGPTPQQIKMAYKPAVKVRLGLVNRHGEQKGVDSLIVTDLISLARNGAISEAVLLTGDEDIRVGVQQAQEYGALVHLVGIAPTRQNQSGLLVQEADSVHELLKSDVQTFLTHHPIPPVIPVPTGSGVVPVVTASAITATPASSDAETASVDPDEIIQRVVTEVAAKLDQATKDALAREAAGGSGVMLPKSIDGHLLKAASREGLGAELTGQQKRRVRDAFIEFCRAT